MPPHSKDFGDFVGDVGGFGDFGDFGLSFVSTVAGRYTGVVAVIVGCAA